MRRQVVTVFGGTGFIGRHLVRRLAARGATIRVPTRAPGEALFLKPMGDVGQIVPIAWDRHEPEQLAALVEGATAVVNLIGILHARKAGDFERLQAQLPGKLGTAAAAAGVGRFVQLSAIGADPASKSVYGRTKAEGEVGLRAAFPAATILRPSIVFGPEDGFFNRFAKMAQLAPALPLVGAGRTRFQPVYVGDVADAIVTALEREDAAGVTYELGGPTVYTFEQLLRWLLQELGRRRFLVPISFELAALQARFLQHLPDPPLTPDQVELLKRDNVVAQGASTLADLAIVPTPLEVVVPDYIRVYARRRFQLPAA